MMMLFQTIRQKLTSLIEYPSTLLETIEDDFKVKKEYDKVLEVETNLELNKENFLRENSEELSKLVDDIIEEVKLHLMSLDISNVASELKVYPLSFMIDKYKGGVRAKIDHIIMNSEMVVTVAQRNEIVNDVMAVALKELDAQLQIEGFWRISD